MLIEFGICPRDYNVILLQAIWKEELIRSVVDIHS